MKQANTANLVLTDLEEGVYAFRFSGTDNEGATAPDEMTLTVIDEQAVASQTNNIRVSAYPNTFQRYVNVEIKAAEQGQYQIKVYDVMGQVHYRNSFEPDPFNADVHRIDLSNLNTSQGVYLIHVEDKSSNFRKVVKIIKGY